jgi:hypothetical protein
MLIIYHTTGSCFVTDNRKSHVSCWDSWSAERRHINENYMHNKGKIKLLCVHLNTTPWRRIQGTGVVPCSLHLSISGGIQLHISLYTHRKCQRCLMGSKSWVGSKTGFEVVAKGKCPFRETKRSLSVLGNYYNNWNIQPYNDNDNNIGLYYSEKTSSYRVLYTFCLLLDGCYHEQAGCDSHNSGRCPFHAIRLKSQNPSFQWPKQWVIRQ